MTTNGQHPGVGLVEPAHMIPAPPPAPTADDGRRAYSGVTVAPPVAAAQPAPQPVQMPQHPPVAAAEPQPVAAAQPAPAPQPRQPGRVRAWFSADSRRGYALGLAAVLTIPAGLWIHGRVTGPDTPAVDPAVAALQTTVSSLQQELASARAGSDVEVNPLNVMPCDVTNDARRFIGINRDGSLVLATSITVARAVQDHVKRGTQDYGLFVLRTGVSVTQLEVDVRGPGVQLFDCGRPAVPSAPAAPAPTTTAPAATQTTGGR